MQPFNCLKARLVAGTVNLTRDVNSFLKHPSIVDRVEVLEKMDLKKIDSLLTSKSQIHFEQLLQVRVCRASASADIVLIQVKTRPL